MSQVRNPLSDWFNMFTYLPTTNWQHAFSPTINFGCNTEDAPVEQHVVDTVGSYGYQLNRVLDALTVVLSPSKLGALTPEQKEKVDAFQAMAREADDAAKEFEGKATQTSVRRLIEGMDKLKKSDPRLYQELADQLRAAIPNGAKPARIKPRNRSLHR